MKQYKIFENQVGLREAVKQGWSWPASGFSFFWAISKKMYATAAALFAAGIVLAILSKKVDELFALGDKSARGLDYLSNVAHWVIIVVLGVNGNEFRERNLLERGYQLRGVVAAASPKEALVSHKKQELEKAHQTA